MSAAMPTSDAVAEARAQPTLDAEVNFFNFGKDGAGEDVGFSPSLVNLQNGRLKTTHPVADGYALRRQVSRVTDYYDNAHVQETLYPDYVNLISALVPEAAHVFVGGHIIRNKAKQRGGVSQGATDRGFRGLA